MPQARPNLRFPKWAEDVLLGGLQGMGKIARPTGRFLSETGKALQAPVPASITGTAFPKLPAAWGKAVQDFGDTIVADVDRHKQVVVPQGAAGKALSFGVGAAPSIALAGPSTAIKIANAAQNMWTGYTEGHPLSTAAAMSLVPGNGVLANTVSSAIEEAAADPRLNPLPALLANSQSLPLRDAGGPVTAGQPYRVARPGEARLNADGTVSTQPMGVHVPAQDGYVLTPEQQVEPAATTAARPREWSHYRDAPEYGFANLTTEQKLAGLNKWAATVEDHVHDIDSYDRRQATDFIEAERAKIVESKPWTESAKETLVGAGKSLAYGIGGTAAVAAETAANAITVPLGLTDEQESFQGLRILDANTKAQVQGGKTWLQTKTDPQAAARLEALDREKAALKDALRYGEHPQEPQAFKEWLADANHRLVTTAAQLHDSDAVDSSVSYNAQEDRDLMRDETNRRLLLAFQRTRDPALFDSLMDRVTRSNQARAADATATEATAGMADWEKELTAYGTDPVETATTIVSAGLGKLAIGAGKAALVGKTLTKAQRAAHAAKAVGLLAGDVAFESASEALTTILDDPTSSAEQIKAASVEAARQSLVVAMLGGGLARLANRKRATADEFANVNDRNVSPTAEPGSYPASVTEAVAGSTAAVGASSPSSPTITGSNEQMGSEMPVPAPAQGEESSLSPEQEAAQNAAADAALANGPKSLMDVAQRGGRVDAQRLQFSLSSGVVQRAVAMQNGFKRGAAVADTALPAVVDAYRLMPDEATITEETQFRAHPDYRSVHRVESKNGGKAWIMHGRDDTVWVNTAEQRSAKLQPAQGADLVYQAAMTYAHNNGLQFRPDPDGVSPIARRRRISQMLSSSLRHGTTAHLLPRGVDAQNQPFEEVPGWRYDNTPEAHAQNIDALARAEYDWVRDEAKKQGVDITRLRWDPADDTVRDDLRKTRLSKTSIEDLLRRLDAERTGIGQTTLSRALITQATIRQARPAGRSGRSAQPDGLQPGGEATVSDPLWRALRDRPLHYSVRTVDGPRLSETVKDTRAVAQSAARLLNQQLPGIVGPKLTFVSNPAELLASNYAAENSFTAEEVAQMQDAEAFFDNDTGYTIVFTDAIEVRPGESERAAVARVILHERVGHDGFNALHQHEAKFRESWDRLSAKIPSTELDALAHDYPHLAGDKHQLALEWFARAVEQRLHLKEGNLAQRLWVALKGLYQRLFEPFAKSLTTESDLRALINQARQAAQNGTAVPTTAEGLRQRLQFTGDAPQRDDLDLGEAVEQIEAFYADPVETDYWPTDLVKKWEDDPLRVAVEDDGDFLAAFPHLPEALRNSPQVQAWAAAYQRYDELQRKRIKAPLTAEEADESDALEDPTNEALDWLDSPDVQSALASRKGALETAAQARAAATVQQIESTGRYKWNRKSKSFDYVEDSDVRLQFSLRRTAARAVSDIRAHPTWRWSMTGSTLPRAFYDVVQATERERTACDQAAAQIGRDLDVAINAHVKRFGKALKDVHDMVAQAMSGAPGTNAVLLAIDPVLAERAREARIFVDDMSKAIGHALPPSELRNNIVLNQGAWLRRSYAAFDPASGWNYDNAIEAAKAGKPVGSRDARAVMRAAAAFLVTQNQYATTQRDAAGLPLDGSRLEGDMRALMDRNDPDSIPNALAGKKVRKDITSLIKRKDIPKELRDLMGEEHNPIKRFIGSTSFQTQFLRRHQQQVSLATIGLNSGLFTQERRGRFTQQIPTNEGWSPLAGLWVEPKVWEALKQVDADQAGQGMGASVLKFLKFTSSEAKFNKVAMSPDSWMVNALGNVSSLTMTGDVFSTTLFERLREAHQVFTSQDKAKSGEALSQAEEAFIDTKRALVARLTAAGVLNESFNQRDLEATLDRSLLAWVETSERTLKDRVVGGIKGALYAQSAARGGGTTARVIAGVAGGIGGAIAGKAKIESVQRAVTKWVMAYPDQMGRLVGYMGNLESALAAGLPADQATAEAIERTRNTFPDYSKVPKAVRDLSTYGGLIAPVGSFIGFQWELYRNFTWNAYYAQADLRSGNATRMVRGGKRIVGAAAVSGALSMGVQALLENMLGSDDDDNEKWRKWFSRPWEAQTFLCFSAWDKDKVSYFNPSYLLPQTSLGEMVKAVAEGESPGDAANRVGSKLYEQFMGGNIAADAIMASRLNVTRTGRPITYRDGWLGFIDRANYAVQNIAEPGWAAKIERLTYAALESKKNGRSYSFGEELQRLFGIRSTTVNWSELVERGYRRLSADYYKARSQAKLEIDLNTPGVTAAALQRANARIRELQAELQCYEQDLRGFRIPESTIKAAGKPDGFTKKFDEVDFDPKSETLVRKR